MVDPVRSRILNSMRKSLKLLNQNSRARNLSSPVEALSKRAKKVKMAKTNLIS